jgi:hypothetical protein
VRLYVFVFTSYHFPLILSGKPKAISNIARQVTAVIARSQLSITINLKGGFKEFLNMG